MKALAELKFNSVDSSIATTVDPEVSSSVVIAISLATEPQDLARFNGQTITPPFETAPVNLCGVV